MAASFSVLSVLPAVLLHISLGSDYRPLWVGGYMLSAIAVALHVVDLLTAAPRFHYAALILVTAGFACITIISVLLELREEKRAAGSRLAGAMGLFLLAISFAHFGSDHPRQEGKMVILHEDDRIVGVGLGADRVGEPLVYPLVAGVVVPACR